MTIEFLIKSLSADVRPVPRNAMDKRLLIAAAIGALFAAAVFFTSPFPAGNLAAHADRMPFLIKTSYSGVIALGAFLMSRHLLSPEAKPERAFLLASAPVLMLAALAVIELANAPRSDWASKIHGHNIFACVSIISALAIPILASLFVGARAFAPTSVRAVGATLGVTAAALGSCIYAVNCIESSSTFVFLWYSFAMLIMAAVGAMLAPRLLRW